MARQILLRSPPVNRKRLSSPDSQIRTETASFDGTPKTKQLQSEDKRKRIGEVAGGTAAECAVVCCCCPCTVMNILILAVYRVPAGICRRARRNLRNRRKKKQQVLLVPTERSKVTKGNEELEKELRAVIERGKSVNDGGGDGTEAVVLEKEMWERFYSTGFWRSSSQREPSL